MAFDKPNSIRYSRGLFKSAASGVNKVTIYSHTL